MEVHSVFNQDLMSGSFEANNFTADLLSRRVGQRTNKLFVLCVRSCESSKTIDADSCMTGLTDVVLSADFLEDVDLLHRRLSDLLDLLRGHLVRGGDVDDLHRVLLRRPLVDAAAHHTAHSPEEEKRQRRPRYLQLCRVRGLCLRSWTRGKHVCMLQSGILVKKTERFCDNCRV